MPIPEEPAGLLLLDTHVWVWVAEGNRSTLSDDAIDAIEEAARRGELRIATISVWEVAMLEARGRISLSMPCEDWVRAALKAPGVALLPLTPEVATESTRLPGEAHGDPADRMLIATARVNGARLATCDRGIIAYAEAGHLSVLDCRS